MKLSGRWSLGAEVCLECNSRNSHPVDGVDRGSERHLIHHQLAVFLFAINVVSLLHSSTSVLFPLRRCFDSHANKVRTLRGCPKIVSISYISDHCVSSSHLPGRRRVLYLHLARSYASAESRRQAIAFLLHKRIAPPGRRRAAFSHLLTDSRRTFGNFSLQSKDCSIDGRKSA